MATVIVSAILAFVLFFAGRKAIQDIRKGKCSGCSNATCGVRDGKDQVCDIKIK